MNKNIRKKIAKQNYKWKLNKENPASFNIQCERNLLWKTPSGVSWQNYFCVTTIFNIINFSSYKTYLFITIKYILITKCLEIIYIHTYIFCNINYLENKKYWKFQQPSHFFASFFILFCLFNRNDNLSQN